MPQPLRPSLPPAVEAVPEVFGSPVRLAIIGCLREFGSATRGEVAAALALVPKTIQFHLHRLETVGAVVSDPPPSADRTGQRVYYSLNHERLDDLASALVDFVRSEPNDS